MVISTSLKLDSEINRCVVCMNAE